MNINVNNSTFLTLIRVVLINTFNWIHRLTHYDIYNPADIAWYWTHAISNDLRYGKVPSDMHVQVLFLLQKRE